MPRWRRAVRRAGELREVRVPLGAGSLFWTQTHAIDLLLFAAGGRRLLGVQALLGGVERGTHSHAVENDPQILSRRCTSRVTSPA